MLRTDVLVREANCGIVSNSAGGSAGLGITKGLPAKGSPDLIHRLCACLEPQIGFKFQPDSSLDSESLWFPLALIEAATVEIETKEIESLDQPLDCMRGRRAVLVEIARTGKVFDRSPRQLAEPARFRQVLSLRKVASHRRESLVIKTAPHAAATVRRNRADAIENRA